MISVKTNKSYKKYLNIAKTVRKNLEGVVDKDEIRSLNDLSSRYKNIFKSKNAVKNKLNSLSDVLMVSTSFLERLVMIKTDLTFLYRKVDTCYKSVNKIISSDPEYLRLKKNEKDAVKSSELSYFLILYASIDRDLEIVNTAIEYHDKLQFNIKSLIKYLIVIFEQES